jgi:hypothetical protein
MRSGSIPVLSSEAAPARRRRPTRWRRARRGWGRSAVPETGTKAGPRRPIGLNMRGLAVTTTADMALGGLSAPSQCRLSLPHQCHADQSPRSLLSARLWVRLIVNPQVDGTEFDQVE